MKSNLKIISILTGLILSIFWTIDSRAQYNWEKHAGNPVLWGNLGEWDTQCWFPVVIQEDGIFKMWYNGSQWIADRQIGYATSEDGIAWVKDEDNPVIPAGEVGSWDHYKYPGTVLRVNDTLKMWWMGSKDSGPESAVGYAWLDEEADEWNLQEDPVLVKGEYPSWDDIGIFNPSVYYDGTLYHMYYSGIGGEDGMDIGYATSGNGINWTKHPSNPVLVHTEGTFYSQWIATSGLVWYNNTLHMFFHGFDASTWDPVFSYFRVGYAWSTDYVTWQIENFGWPVLWEGVAGEWDDRAVRTPSVIVHNDSLKMWYTGYQLDGTCKIGYAVGDKVITGTGLSEKSPLASGILGIGPNPFTHEAAISYRLAGRTAVRAEVRSGCGQTVATLINEILGPGEHRVVLDGRDLPPGLYFCTLKTGEGIWTEKMIKVR